MRFAFDLDGTLYDSLHNGYTVQNKICEELGYENIDVNHYRSVFQTSDWNKLCRDLGFEEDHLEYVIERFFDLYSKVEQPTLIDGAKEILNEVEQNIGHENIFVISNADFNDVEFRFRRDGLEHYLDRVDTPFEGKAKELERLSLEHREFPFFYVGDIVSDGEACFDARNNGAKNLNFCAVAHEYSMNTKEKLSNFVYENREFAYLIEELSGLKQFL